MHLKTSKENSLIKKHHAEIYVFEYNTKSFKHI